MILIKYENKNFLDLSEAEQETIFEISKRQTIFCEDANGEKYQVLDLREGLDEE